MDQQTAWTVERDARTHARDLEEFSGRMMRATGLTMGGTALGFLLVLARHRQAFPELPWAELDAMAERMAAKMPEDG